MSEWASMVSVNTECRDCKSKDLVRFLDLGNQPLANRFLSAGQLQEPEPRFPLEVYFCSNCNLVQLIHVVDKSTLFSHYVYFSSGMPKVSAHWKGYAVDVTERFLSDKKDLVLEIGSNDGVLLKFFKESGYQVLGVDPAANIAEVARSGGVPTLTTFFNKEVAERIVREYGKPKAILANNVFAHIDDHHSVCHGVKALLDPQGVFVVEAPYLMDMFENLTYDTIYHEHLSFLSVRPLKRLFESFGMEIFDIKIVPSQGQSLRLFVGHQGAHPISPKVGEFVVKELDAKLDRAETYFELARRVMNSKNKVVEFLTLLKKQGKTIAAYGAPAKGNTLLNYFEVGPQILEYALEDLPSKQGFYTPGTRIPVVERRYAQTHAPDYYLLLAWNYAKAVLEKEQEHLKRGGKFIIPVGDDVKVI